MRERMAAVGRRKHVEAARLRLKAALGELRRRQGVIRQAYHARRVKLTEMRRRVVKRSKAVAKKMGHGLVGMWHKYGWIGIGTYLSVYVSTLSLLFAAVNTGIFTADDAKRYLESLPEFFSKHIDASKLSSGVDTVWGRFLVAWVLTKIVEPARALTTVALVPLVLRVMGRGGPAGQRAGALLKKAAGSKAGGGATADKAKGT
ncbi:unnamed protein product [Vitrella brassicaformis CCMP3155]|uniref:DUF1279 domain-containing protein n=1 Tax=Vitrella brassicaformis (strain CCMP3155) TaxID=1169540 RepID=A0A0G4H3W9_VITBC|nr:unnamed protein product [Vitrella brassicaformis CCMP3155]|eukprot:CEM38402.1 unnamed protein product [Vitrella brassicaformis CCMP3155]